MFLLTKLIFRCPLTTDWQAHSWSHGKSLPCILDGAAALMLVAGDHPKHSPTTSEGWMVPPYPTCSPDASSTLPGERSADSLSLFILQTVRFL